MLNIERIRRDFPILNSKMGNQQLAYLDNAATTQKPGQVLDVITEFYTRSYSNIHRGVYLLSRQAEREYEEARERVKDFINAGSREEIIFTGGTTEAINLAAGSFGEAMVREGDEVIISGMEHHSNIIPWQRLCHNRGAGLRVIPVSMEGSLNLGRLEELISSRTRLIAVTHVSNVLGVINPVEKIIRRAHRDNIPVLVDGAQAVQHLPVDVSELDCDFYVFSGHKIYASTGIGVLYGKKRWLEAMPPYQSGGGMIESVNIGKTSYAGPPMKFEPGTANVAGAVSLKRAVDYVEEKGLEQIAAHEEKLLSVLVERLKKCEGVTIYAPSANRCGVLSFNLDGIHPFDAGMILDKMGIAVRTGTHCAQPLMKSLGTEGTVRASLALYNTEGEIDRLIRGVRKIQNMMEVS